MIDSQSRVSLLVRLFLAAFVLGEMSLCVCARLQPYMISPSRASSSFQTSHISAPPPTLVSMDTGGPQAAAAKLLRILGNWTRLVSKLHLLSYLRGLWGTLGRYLQNFKGLK